jgi:hypothetical protein
VDEAVELIRSAAPHRWRDHVQNFSLSRQLVAIQTLLRNRVAEQA